MIQIALLDDHAIIRDGIKHLLLDEADIAICAECERPSALAALLKLHAPDVLIIDLNMPEGGGFPLLQSLRPAYPDMRIIVLSMHESHSFVAKAFSMGADAYISKTRATEELLPAVRAVLRGERCLSSDLLQASRTQDALLSPRETEVLKGLLQGKNAKRIAAELGITDKTLYAHRTRLMHKLQVSNIAELPLRALNLGLV
jgi:DNA-binding NarL/FixJ family response regulator